MEPGAWGAVAAMTVFALTATFYAGVMYARMAAIEAWRLELRADWAKLMKVVRGIELKVGARED